MITLLQRVTQARVEVGSEIIAAIKTGILVLVGVQADDDEATARHYVDRLLNYRVFGDSDGRMNLSLKAVEGGLLLVPQFTLAADTRASHDEVECGRFGADMQVHLVNDGPVSFILD